MPTCSASVLQVGSSRLAQHPIPEVQPASLASPTAGEALGVSEAWSGPGGRARETARIEALRMLSYPGEALTRRWLQTVNRLHALLAELPPWQPKKGITTGQATSLLASGRPLDLAGKTYHGGAATELA